MTNLPSGNEYCVIAAVNNDDVLALNLERSSVFKNNPHYLMRDYNSAGKAYNCGIDKSESEILIFAHQDVYFPVGWENKLSQEISNIEKEDQNWAVIGVYGIDLSGAHVGHCWSTGLGRVIGSNFYSSRKVISIDELVIIIRRSSGLRFDENLPGFHLYGTDIVQSANAIGLHAYVIDAPVVHNSSPVISLRGRYQDAYSYMRKKWIKKLPLNTVIVKVTKTGWPLTKQILKMAFNRYIRRRIPIAQPTYTGSEIAKRVGFE